MELDPVSVILKFGFLAVLYLFLLWIARSALKDLRTSTDMVPAQPADATGDPFRHDLETALRAVARSLEQCDSDRDLRVRDRGAARQARVPRVGARAGEGRGSDQADHENRQDDALHQRITLGSAGCGY